MGTCVQPYYHLEEILSTLFQQMHKSTAENSNSAAGAAFNELMMRLVRLPGKDTHKKKKENRWIGVHFRPVGTFFFHRLSW